VPKRARSAFRRQIEIGLISIAGFKQRAAGVYIESEASHCFVTWQPPCASADLIARRASRTSVFVKLQLTVEGVRDSFLTVARSAGVPASAEQLRLISAALSIELRICESSSNSAGLECRVP
jgi:hypothetical protein